MGAGSEVGARQREQLWGRSASALSDGPLRRGGYRGAVLTLDPEYLQSVGSNRSIIRAMVGLSGPYDFLPPKDDRAAFGLSPAATQPDPQIEPIHFVDGQCRRCCS